MLKLQKNIDLQARHTLAAPSTARYFAECDTEHAVHEACEWAESQGLPIRVLGEGSNVLLAEALPVLILRMGILGFDAQVGEDGEVTLWCGAGENWHSVVARCVNHGYHGIENLALIPGTVGAAPIQNIGAYGVELESVFQRLECIDTQTGKQQTFEKADCHFAYRDSFFKSAAPHRYIITRVCLKLSTAFHPVLSYAPLNELQNDETLTAKTVFDCVCATRRAKLPDPASVPNAGSFFKNPLISVDAYQKLLTRYPNMPCYVLEGSKDSAAQVKVPAAWLIDRLGWKKKELHGVHVHERQALVVCNPERRALSDILSFSAALQEDVRRHFGISLEREPQILF